MSKPRPKRNIRVTGKRVPFDANRFVDAVMVHAEALSKAEKAKGEVTKVPSLAEQRLASRPIRDGAPWTEDDLVRLRVLRELGRPNHEIARRIGRIEGALTARITELNKGKQSEDKRAA